MAEQPITFATVNLYNLQSPGVPMYRGNTYTRAQYDAKIDWTASILQRLDADVIGFQELWQPAPLLEAFQAAGLDNQYTIVASDRNPAGIEVALAVRSPHQRVHTSWLKDFPDELVLRKRAGAANQPDYEVSVAIDRFSRAVLRVSVRPAIAGVNAVPSIAVYVAHLKSKLPMRLDSPEQRDNSIRPHSAALGSALSTIRRTAEAAALRVALNKTMRRTDTPVVVLGDLNDAQRSVTTSVITGQPKYRLFASSGIGRASDKGLYSAATLQEYRSLRDVYYTHIHDGQRESLDHILVSEQFYDYSRNRVWTFKEMRTINDHLDDEDDRSSSDHAAIAATFLYDPA